MKRYFAILLVITMCVVSTIPASAASPDVGASPSLVVEGEEMKNLVNLYPDEIALVESICKISIREINEDNLREISTVAIDYLADSNYNFSGLMTDLSVLYTERQLDSYIVTGYAHDDDVYTDNVEVTPFRAYGALKGKYIDEVPTGSEKTDSGAISLGVSGGEILEGVQISFGFSK